MTSCSARRSAPRCGPSRRLALLLPALLLSACPKPPPPRTPADCKPPPIEIFLQADETLNLNEKGQSQPVEVRILLLRSRTNLEQADFETVWKDAASLLGKDLVQSASLTVFPGKLKIYPMQSTPEVSHVALVGLFRQPKGHGWRHIVDVRETNRRCAGKEELHSIVHAQLRGNRITKAN